MNILLTLKHWQIFLLIVGSPFVVQVIQSIWFITTEPEIQSSFPMVLGLIVIIPLLIYFIWIGTVGKRFSQSKISPSMKTGKFEISLWISCLGHIFLLIYFWAYPHTAFEAEGEESSFN
jgi:hypothetical protein